MSVAGQNLGGTTAAEIVVDGDLARSLLAAQHPDLADLPIALAATGWDNAVFRLGEALAIRLPRRAVAARLIAHEQRWLPLLKDRLSLAIPAPVRVGVPQGAYPWPWSVTPWFEGDTADLAPPNDDQGEVLGGFFAALHQPAPANAPLNPVRGVPLIQRVEVFEARVAGLARRGYRVPDAITAIWTDALAAPDDAAPTWIQGDPHPRNVLTRAGRIVAVIDWGDIAQGDRASDLAGVWMLLRGVDARRRAMAACRLVSDATWRRARGWAVLYGVMLMEAGLADDPRMAAIAATTFERLIEGPSLIARSAHGPVFSN
jgi:aminoglycoside phosphotransferase (APT) family kinase protein